MNDWYLKSEHEVASDTNVNFSYVTYATRQIENVTEVAIVSWFYTHPTLIALFHGTELIAGTLLTERK